MKKIVFCLGVVLILGMINISHLQDFYHTFLGNKYYQEHKLEMAKQYFEKVQADNRYFNVGNVYYQQENYKKARDAYLQIKVENDKKLYNLGNVYFRLGEFENTEENWEKSVGYYRESLAKKYSEKAEKNLAFVLEKLKHHGEGNLSEQQKKSPASLENFEKKYNQDKNSEFDAFINDPFFDKSLLQGQDYGLKD